MARYAAGTEVSVERSGNEIEGILRRYKCQAFSYSYADLKERRVEEITFVAKTRKIRFRLELPVETDKQFKRRTVRGQIVANDAGRAFRLWEQACREKWRALVLCIKAKLEAVDAGITHFGHEFMAQMVDVETGKTIGELFEPWFAGRLTTKELLGLPAPKDEGSQA